MAETLPMLALSPTMEEGMIVKWNVAEGGSISSGQVLCEVQTDKATMEYESPADGMLLKILVPEGSSVRVGEPIAIVGESGEDISGLLESLSKPAPKTEAPPAAALEESRSPPHAPAAEAKPLRAGKIRASPLARKLASGAGIDLKSVVGTGPEGRIVKRDIEAYLRKAPEVSAETEGRDKLIPVSPKRKIIAERLGASKFSAPHFYLRVRVAFDTLLETRARFNAQRAQKLSLNAFLIKLTAEALKRHPQVNAAWEGENIRLFGGIHIALAVAQEDGLVAPVVRNCAAKGVEAIDRELSELIEKARKGTIAPEEYSGATFTISNLGSYGIEEFTAIINPPGSAILAVGAAVPTEVLEPDGGKKVKRLASFTLSCDHRVVDGAVGAAFLRDLKLFVEDPLLAFL